MLVIKLRRLYRAGGAGATALIDGAAGREDSWAMVLTAALRAVPSIFQRATLRLMGKTLILTLLLFGLLAAALWLPVLLGFILPALQLLGAGNPALEVAPLQFAQAILILC